MNVDQAPRRRLWRMVYRSRCARHITKQPTKSRSNACEHWSVHLPYSYSFARERCQVCVCVCMCVCVCVCVCEYVFVCMHVCMYPCLHVCLYVCTVVCVYAIGTSLHARTHVTHACMYAYMNTFTHACMYADAASAAVPRVYYHPLARGRAWA